MSKYFLRVISLLLTCVMLINLLPLGVYAEDLQEAVSTPEDVQEISEDAQIVGEVIESRTAFPNKLSRRA